METKQQQKKEHGVEIQFSSISPLELWKKLGLEQPLEVFAMQEPTEFADDESKRAFEVFRNDFTVEKGNPDESILISSNKGSIFIWSLLKETSKRSPISKLSSKKFFFKDNLLKRICKKVNELDLSPNFSEKDFEDIILYLENKKLILTSIDGIRITQHFENLFHKKYKAWLVF